MASTVKFYINTSASTTPSTTECTASDAFAFTGTGGVSGGVAGNEQAPADNYIVVNEFWINEGGSGAQCGRYEGGGSVGVYDASPAWTLTNDDYLFIEITVTSESAAGKWTFWNTSSHAATTGEPLQDVDFDATTVCWIRAEETANNVTMALASDDSTSAGYKAQTDKTATYQIFGAGSMITFSGAVTANNCNRMVLHAFLPHNATGGAKAWVGSYYNYTT